MLNNILNEHRPLTPQTAMLFEATLGISANLLIGIQADYDICVIKQDKSFLNHLAEIRKSVAVL
jgi:plasmid maintenance system antidote protein VapI